METSLACVFAGEWDEGQHSFGREARFHVFVVILTCAILLSPSLRSNNVVQKCWICLATAFRKRFPLLSAICRYCVSQTSSWTQRHCVDAVQLWHDTDIPSFPFVGSHSHISYFSSSLSWTGWMLLSSNDFSGPLPSEIGHLTRLGKWLGGMWLGFRVCLGTLCPPPPSVFLFFRYSLPPTDISFVLLIFVYMYTHRETGVEHQQAVG